MNDSASPVLHVIRDVISTHGNILIIDVANAVMNQTSPLQVRYSGNKCKIYI
jgi:hypothetical protein